MGFTFGKVRQSSKNYIRWQKHKGKKLCWNYLKKIRRKNLKKIKEKKYTKKYNEKLEKRTKEPQKVTLKYKK